jgi:hypothetical protein
MATTIIISNREKPRLFWWVLADSMVRLEYLSVVRGGKSPRFILGERVGHGLVQWANARMRLS